MEMKPSFRDLSCITMNFDSYCGKILITEVIIYKELKSKNIKKRISLIFKLQNKMRKLSKFWKKKIRIWSD